MKGNHCQGLEETADDTADEVKGEKAFPPDGVFDAAAEPKDGKTVEDNVPKVGMEKLE
jgi:hypothetical protein